MQLNTTPSATKFYHKKISNKEIRAKTSVFKKDHFPWNGPVPDIDDF